MTAASPDGSAGYKVIVVGTDGSERASIAVGEALALAKVTGATLHAVHVVHPGVSASFVDTPAAQFEFEVAAARGHAENARKRLLAEAERQGVAVEVHNPPGPDVADALLEVARAVDADLLVVGNLGMSGIKRFVLGSVPNKVAHHCPCNLLIVNTEST